MNKSTTLPWPKLQKHAMAGTEPYKANAATQQALGFPEKLVEDWQAKAITKLGELVDNNRGLKVFMDSCMNCGACTDKCHYLLGTGDPKNMPVARQNLLRSVYRRYYTWAGKYLPWLVGAKDLDREMLDDWYSYFHQCSQCRRCAVYCPIGIDTTEFSVAARQIMDSIGLGQKYTNEIIVKARKTGNNLGMPIAALKHALQDLEEELHEETGHNIRLPLNRPGADILLVTPSADFYAEPHVDALLGYAKVFYKAGLSWTLSSHAAEAASFSLFSGNQPELKHQAEVIREAAVDLGVKRLVFGECGHAWRVAHNYFADLAGSLDFLDQNYPRPQHICELTHELIQSDIIQFDTRKNDDKVVTFHDSCNIARASRLGNKAGDQFTIPRDILQACCTHAVDMDEHSIEEETFCCGAGGGLLTDELMELRQKGALPRVTALKEVIRSQGVTHMAAICAICKTQLGDVLPHYGLRREQVVSLHQLVGNAIIL